MYRYTSEFRIWIFLFSTLCEHLSERKNHKIVFFLFRHTSYKRPMCSTNIKTSKTIEHWSRKSLCMRCVATHTADANIPQFYINLVVFNKHCLYVWFTFHWIQNTIQELVLNVESELRGHSAEKHWKHEFDLGGTLHVVDNFELLYFQCFESKKYLFTTIKMVDLNLNNYWPYSRKKFRWSLVLNLNRECNFFGQHDHLHSGLSSFLHLLQFAFIHLFIAFSFLIFRFFAFPHSI